jgi:predicted MFS family arabinose efflux permease
LFLAQCRVVSFCPPHRPALATGKKAAPLSSERFIGALGAACRYAAHAPGMQTVLARAFAFIFCGVAVTSLLPVQATHRLHLPASQFGLLMGAFGCGAITMAVAGLPRLRARLAPDTLMHLATGTLGAVLLAMIFSNSLGSLLPVTFLGGAAWIAGISNLAVASQTAMPAWARGRMNALYITVMQGSIALGGLTWGQTTAALGLSTALAVAGGALLATMLFAVKVSAAAAIRARSHRRESNERARFPGTTEADDGPVIVMVEYLVAKAQAAEFLAA